jgi:hypothetical protein
MQSLDYLLEVLKTKELHEITRVEQLCELVKRWKRNPALSLEPIYLNGNLTFKNPPLDDMINSVGKSDAETLREWAGKGVTRDNRAKHSSSNSRRTVRSAPKKAKIPPIAAE